MRKDFFLKKDRYVLIKATKKNLNKGKICDKKDQENFFFNTTEIEWFCGVKRDQQRKEREKRNELRKSDLHLSISLQRYHS